MTLHVSTNRSALKILNFIYHWQGRILTESPLYLHLQFYNTSYSECTTVPVYIVHLALLPKTKKSEKVASRLKDNNP